MPFNIQMTQVKLDKTSVLHALVIAEMQFEITKKEKVSYLCISSLFLSLSIYTKFVFRFFRSRVLDTLK